MKNIIRYMSIIGRMVPSLIAVVPTPTIEMFLTLSWMRSEVSPILSVAVPHLLVGIRNRIPCQGRGGTPVAGWRGGQQIH